MEVLEPLRNSMWPHVFPVPKHAKWEETSCGPLQSLIISLPNVLSISSHSSLFFHLPLHPLPHFLFLWQPLPKTSLSFHLIKHLQHTTTCVRDIMSLHLYFFLRWCWDKSVHVFLTWAVSVFSQTWIKGAIMTLFTFVCSIPDSSNAAHADKQRIIQIIRLSHRKHKAVWWADNISAGYLLTGCRPALTFDLLPQATYNLSNQRLCYLHSFPTCWATDGCKQSPKVSQNASLNFFGCLQHPTRPLCSKKNIKKELRILFTEPLFFHSSPTFVFLFSFSSMKVVTFRPPSSQAAHPVRGRLILALHKRLVMASITIKRWEALPYMIHGNHVFAVFWVQAGLTRTPTHRLRAPKFPLCLTSTSSPFVSL